MYRHCKATVFESGQIVFLANGWAHQPSLCFPVCLLEVAPYGLASRCFHAGNRALSRNDVPFFPLAIGHWPCSFVKDDCGCGVTSKEYCLELHAVLARLKMQFLFSWARKMRMLLISQRNASCCIEGMILSSRYATLSHRDRGF